MMLAPRLPRMGCGPLSSAAFVRDGSIYVGAFRSRLMGVSVIYAGGAESTDEGAGAATASTMNRAKEPNMTDFLEELRTDVR